MGETTCLMQPFSYVAGISNEAKEGNPIQAVGQSISFGRFMSESLAWEKWSTFSHNRYVEEAEKFSRPGSVAQKKAFFEAHYKNLAARKAAAALLEQANAAAAAESKNVTEPEYDQVQDTKPQNSNTANEAEEVKVVEGADPRMEDRVLAEKCVNVESLSQLGGADDKEEVADMELSGKKEMEKPLLKNFNSSQDLASMGQKKHTSRSSNYGRASKLSSSPAPIGPKKENIATTPMNKKFGLESADRKKSTPKSSHKSMNFTPVRELNRLTSTIIRKIDGSKTCSNSKAPSKDCSTPLRTPTKAPVNGVQKQSLVTPQSENRRARATLDSSASGSKAVRPKWNFLPTDCSKFLSASRNKSQSPSLSTQFGLRTEERAARRKEKLEERFNANQAQKGQQQATFKDRAETELRKLRQSLCFKARPLPAFYKQRGTPGKEMTKAPLMHPQSPKLGRHSTFGTIQRTSQPPQSASINGGSSNNILEKKSQTTARSSTLRSILVARENKSPNIQHK